MSENSNTGRHTSLTHLRGSLGLLTGRVFSLALDFVSHVLVVRTLTQNNFAAFGYALALSTLLITATMVGLPESLARYVPLYRGDERHGAAAGAFIVAVVSVLVASLGAVALVIAFAPALTRSLPGGHAVAVLSLLVFVVPLEAVNGILGSLFAALGHVWSIFFRQHILTPVTRIAVVAIVVTQTQSPVTIALGYLGASAAGLVLYLVLSARVLRGELGLGTHPLVYPVREVLGFALPVFLSSLFYLLMTTAGTVLLGLLSTSREVASFQAVAPTARLNSLALTMFAILYVPTVSSYLRAGDHAAIARTFDSTTFWIVVLGLPVFFVSTAFGPTFSAGVFGHQYRGAGVILAILACAYYVQSAYGMNDMTLRLYRRLRMAIRIDTVSLAIGLVVTVGLIEVDGGRGAALGLLIAVLVRSTSYDIALARTAGISVFRGRYMLIHAAVVATWAILFVINELSHPGILLVCTYSLAAGLLLLFAFRGRLELSQMLGDRFGRALRPFERIRRPV